MQRQSQVNRYVIATLLVLVLIGQLAEPHFHELSALGREVCGHDLHLGGSADRLPEAPTYFEDQCVQCGVGGELRKAVRTTASLIDLPLRICRSTDLSGEFRFEVLALGASRGPRAPPTLVAA